MLAHSSCRFCSINDGKFSYGKIDHPIASNDNFFVIPSVGALVEGWTLIVPRKHVYSMKSFFLDELFVEIVDQTLSALQQIYEKILIFEHGATHESSLTSCGTAHAHLHLVPLNESLYDDIEKSGWQWNECKASEVSKAPNGVEYLFYSEINNTQRWKDHVGLMHMLKSPISQYFRKLIAKHCNLEEQFDYKFHPFLNNASQTHEQLSRFF